MHHLSPPFSLSHTHTNTQHVNSPPLCDYCICACMFTGVCVSTCLRSHAAWVIMAVNRGPDNCRGPGWIFVVWGVSVGGRKWADQTAEDCFGLKETCEVEAWIQAVCVHWQQTSSYLSLLYNFPKGGTAWILSWDVICQYHVSLNAAR